MSNNSDGYIDIKNNDVLTVEINANLHFDSIDSDQATIIVNELAYDIQNTSGTLIFDVGDENEHVFTYDGEIDSIATGTGRDFYIKMVDISNMKFSLVFQNANAKEHMVFVYNENNADSIELANYYINVHDLNDSHKISVQCSSSEILDSFSEFQDEVETELKSKIDNFGFDVKTIVLIVKILQNITFMIMQKFVQG